MNDDTLYLDHAATTPVRPEVRAAMAPYLEQRFGNPSSVHAVGRDARGGLEEARERVASVLGAARSEVVFTGSGTEADNLAVLGRWRAAEGGVAVSAIEHSAVRSAAAQAAREGAALTTLAVDEHGRVDRGALDEALGEPLAVVSVMWGNNEVGVLQDVAAIAGRCRERGVVFHTDAVQAVGHVPVSIEDVPVDLLALSGHKFGGPRGVGALFIREGVAVAPLLHGGGQERGLRPGTVNVAGAVGLAVALERAVAELADEADRLTRLRDRLEAAIVAAAPAVRINAHGADRLPHILSVRIPGLEADVLLAALDLAGLAVSTGSACHSGTSTPSAVQIALGGADETTLRLSLGWTTTDAEIARASDRLTQVLTRLEAGTA